MTTSSDAISDAELGRLGSAWEEFILAVRRARARRGESGGDLTLSQYEFLRPLRVGRGLPVSQLAERFGIAPGTATGILDGLAKLGVIERSRTAEDRRTVTVTLTEEGRRRFERKRRSIARQRRMLLESLTPEERVHTERLLRRLAQVITQL